MVGRLDFAVDGADWPNRDLSRFVAAGGIRWHVQETGDAEDDRPVALMLHGTGAATHSWHAMLPDLAEDFQIVAPDLPGHGFTGQPAQAQLSLTGMAMLCARLIKTLGKRPNLIIGHSAGAAIAARMCLDGAVDAKAVISLGGALLPLGGPRGGFYAVGAKLFALNPLTPRLFAWRARNPDVVSELLGRTGSEIDPEALRCYSILARSSNHAGAALGMMANWDLQALARDLPGLKPGLLLVTAEKDRMIPASYAERVHALVPGSELVNLDGLGHLAHEEAPAKICGMIRDFWRKTDRRP